MGVSSSLGRLLSDRACRLLLALLTGLAGQAGAQSRPPTAPVDPPAVAVGQRTVPHVIGLELRLAQRRLKGAGFDSDPISIDGSQDGQRQVSDTNPVASRQFPADALPRVKVFHRRAPGDDVQPLPKMPRLIGATCSEARKQIASLGRTLASCAVGEVTGRFVAGRINRQDPQPDTQLSATSTPRVWTEPETATVPEVRNLPVRTAVSRIEAARLRPDFDQQQFDNWHWVQDQRPLPGTTLAPNSPVRLTLVARYVVPDLSGLDCDAAGRRVLAAGLRGLGCQPEMSANQALPAGRIHRQDPPPLTRLSVVQNVRAWVQPAMVAVPNVVGLDEAAAKSRLAQSQLQAQPIGPPADAGRQVVTQFPVPDTLLQPNGLVRITLQLTVPAVRGLDCDTAKARAREHGLLDASCEFRRAGASEPINRVFDQTPPPRTLLAAAQRLVAVIAQPVVVPDVVGRALPAALATLRQSDLDGRADASDGDREVRSQQPRAGTPVAPGSTVALTTAAFALVPDVTGLPLDDAGVRVRGGGFVAVDDVAGGASRTDRNVREQEPKAGTRRQVGTRVQLVTYREIVVPDVTRLRLPEAGARLRQAGLAGKADRDDFAADREVRTQTPAAGQRAPERSEVLLQTVRKVVVPRLLGLSDSDARATASAAGLRLDQCQVDSGLVPRLLLGSITVIGQTPATSDVVDEGSVVTCSAKASLLPLMLLGSVLGVGGGTLLWRMRPRLPSGPKPQLLALHWHVDPDVQPKVALRFADAGARGLQTAWRRVDEEPKLCLRGEQAMQGENDDEQR
jgi:beta-lactam-binding protein with PASTA domain